MGIGFCPFVPIKNSCGFKSDVVIFNKMLSKEEARRWLFIR
jgi:hypothetical protein